MDEWELYEPHHRARMAFRPGLTGMWQVSGRSNITDFEEVVKLDTKYISEWSLNKGTFSMAYSLYHQCRSEKELFIVHGADHAESYRTDPEKYKRTVSKFLKKYAAVYIQKKNMQNGIYSLTSKNE